MTSETLIDNFNDNSLNTTVWTFPQGTGNITETSAQFHIAAKTSYDYAKTNKTHNLTNEYFAVKWIPGTGTATASVTFILTADDSAGNQVMLATTPVNTGWQFQAGGAATVTGTTSGTGLGTSLASGTWFGIGRIQADNLLHLYKSTDGVTWTDMASCTVGGTFDKTKVQFRIQAGFYTVTETPTWVCNIDEAAVWDVNARDKVHVRSGAAWVESAIKARSGAAWVGAKPKVRIGGVWVPSH